MLKQIPGYISSLRDGYFVRTASRVAIFAILLVGGFFVLSNSALAAAPTVTIAAPSAATATSGPVTYSVTIAGSTSIPLSASFVTLNKTGTANGTVGTATSSGAATITISSITGNGTLGITISAGAAVNLAEISATTSPSTTFTVDNTAPTAAMTYSPNRPVKDADTLRITATFSEPVADANGAKIGITYTGGISALSATAMTKTDTTHYYYDLNVPAGDGVGTVALSAATDVTGNAITGAPTSGTTITVDNTVPSNQGTVFAADITASIGEYVTIVSSADATNNVWFAPVGTTSFAAGDTMTTAGGTATYIAAPNIIGTYKMFVVDAAGNVSSASSKTLTTINAGKNNNSISAGDTAVYVPSILYFTAQPATVSAGQSATLSWSVANASALSMDQGVGSLTTMTNGTTVVSPTVTTTYTLTATGSSNQSVSASVTVTVPGTTPAPVSTAPTTQIPSTTITLTSPFGVPNGSLVKIDGSGTVYLVAEGMLKPFTSAAIFNANGKKFADVQTITADQFASATVSSPMLYPDGTLIRGNGPTIYLVSGGAKKGIPSMAVFNRLKLSLKKVIKLNDADLAAYPDAGVQE